MNPCLALKKISKSFNTPVKINVLTDISLDFFPKTSYALAGSSGEGKTTLLHILAALEKADSGKVIINGVTVSSLNASKIRNQKIGLVFQSYNLLEDLTVMENLLVPLQIARIKIEKKHRDMALSLLTEVGLEKKVDTQAHLLSGGEKQRVAIARALILDPDIVLADEPTGNLDHVTSEKIHHILLDCVRKKGKCLIVATHDKDLASLCDQKYLLQNGLLLPA